MFDQAIVRDAKRGHWLRFTDCVDSVSCRDASAVSDLLAEIERRCQQESLHAVGYVSYEAAPAFDASLPTQATQLPLIGFALFNTPEVLDTAPLPGVEAASEYSEWRLGESQEAFQHKVESVRSLIAEGAVYQINLTSRLSQSGVLTESDFFRIAEGMPYATFLSGPELAIASASPELFFERVDGRLVSRPMKGTVRRGTNQATDSMAKAWLECSEKNRAENVMITDMVRNDISRVASKNRVVVDELCAVEAFPSVWQMISTVSSDTNSSLVDIFRALFPAASITGAPKRAAMEAIKSLEDQPRELYTGAIGHIEPSGNAVFNVAIRTAWIDKLANRSVFGAGCGIVWDSDPYDEYAELMAKTKILKRPSAAFHLFETMLLEASGSFQFMTEHLDRLEASAEFLGFTFDRSEAHIALADLAAETQGPKRVRLQLDRDGRVGHQVKSLRDTLLARSDCVRLAIAETPVDSGDMFVCHKTSHRTVYDQAVAEVPRGTEPLLVNELGHVTESAIANLVYEIGGQLYTPPVSDGLLPGVLRGVLIKEGKLIERSLCVTELADVTGWWLVNALRGWREAKLVSSTLPDLQIA